MKLNNIKRITTDDFSGENKALIDRLAFALNPFLEQITAAFNKNIDFDNLNQEVINFTVEVGTTGIPKTQTVIKSSLRTRVRGITCINASDVANGTTTPTSCPFITYTASANLLTISNITGLPANTKYNLTVILIG